MDAKAAVLLAKGVKETALTGEVGEFAVTKMECAEDSMEEAYPVEVWGDLTVGVQEAWPVEV